MNCALWISDYTSSPVFFLFHLHSVCVYVVTAGVGQTQGHGQHGGAAAGVRGGGRDLRGAAGGDYSALPLPAAALQGHEGSGNVTPATD